MDQQPRLTASLTIQILEATGHFTFLKEFEGSLEFWDSQNHMSRMVVPNMQLSSLIGWISVQSKHTTDNEEVIQVLSKERFSKTVIERDYGIEAIGAFNHVGTKPSNDYTILTPDEEVRAYEKELNLKEGQFLARYETPTSKVGGLRPLIVIDLIQNKVFFLEEETEEMKFCNAGSQFRYLKLRQSWYNLKRCSDCNDMLTEDNTLKNVCIECTNTNYS